ncbi:MAG: hypothetical protein RI894_2379, partial [Bacteroidota bacterium]
MKTTLITGGAGFIGSNFVLYFLKKYPNQQIVNLDALTYAANLDYLQEANSFKNYFFEKGDICDNLFLKELFEKYDIHHIIHLAAESHVDNSITGPAAFVQTNILGTFNLLEKARQAWFD